MDRRLEFHEKLKAILGSDHVYFQPPSSIRMQYPAICYKRKTYDVTHSNNRVYLKLPLYEVTVIGDRTDGTIAERILDLTLCEHVSHYVSDNLNHDVFNIYY